MAHRQGVDGHDEIGGPRTRDACDVHQAVELAVELFQRGVDAARIGQINLDVARHRGAGGVAVQRDHLGTGGQELSGGRVSNARGGAGDHEPFAGEVPHG